MRDFLGTDVTTRLEQVRGGTKIPVTGLLESDSQVRELLVGTPKVAELLDDCRQTIRTARRWIELARQAISISEQLTGKTLGAAEHVGTPPVRARDAPARSRRAVRR
jgi:hypothetical protein